MMVFFSSNYYFCFLHIEVVVGALLTTYITAACLRSHAAAMKIDLEGGS